MANARVLFFSLNSCQGDPELTETMWRKSGRTPSHPEEKLPKPEYVGYDKCASSVFLLNSCQGEPEIRLILRYPPPPKTSDFL